MSLLYFAYGSNLDPAQMRQRCPGTQAHGPALLPEHRVVFAGVSRTGSGGGCATVLPPPGHQGPGFLYRLTGDDLADLDRHEGNYRRDRLTVHSPGGEALSAWVYIRKKSEPRRPPSPAYLALMAYAYGRLGYDLEPLLTALPEGAAPRRPSPLPHHPLA